MNTENGKRLIEIAGDLLPDTWGCWFGVGDGWVDVLARMLTRLRALKDSDLERYEALRLGQVKEKFGLLCVYLYPDFDEAQDIVDEAQAESSKFCEDCGAADAVTSAGGQYWILTLCNKCRIMRSP